MRIPRGPVTDFLVISFVLVFVALWVLGRDQAAFERLGFASALVSEAVELGDPLAILDAFLVRPITSAFVHTGFLDLAFSMMILLLTGRFVEGAMGGRGLIILFVAGAYAAALAQFVIDPHDLTISVGASNAGAAIIAAYFLLYAKVRTKPIGPLNAYWSRRLQLLALWAFINLALFFVTGSAGGVAIFAQMGGFVAGLILTQPLLNRGVKQRR